MALLEKDDYLRQLAADATSNQDASLDCSICHEVVQQATETPCKHTFCLPCLMTWIGGDQAANSTCPACRQQLCAPNEAEAEQSDDAYDDDELPSYPRIELGGDILCPWRIFLVREIIEDLIDEFAAQPFVNHAQCFVSPFQFRGGQLVDDVEYVFEFSGDIEVVAFLDTVPIFAQDQAEMVAVAQNSTTLLRNLFRRFPLVLFYIVCRAVHQYAEINAGDDDELYEA